MENKIVAFKDYSLKIIYHFSPKNECDNCSDFWDWLGGYDIVSAYEIGNVVCVSGDVYEFGENKMYELLSRGCTVLRRIAPLEEYVEQHCPDKQDFISWYY